MLLLRNVIQDYAWGPVDGLAKLVGSEPTGDHEAELWVGTHERGPSLVAAGDHEGETLADVIAGDPKRWLGAEAAAHGIQALAYLLKVLAIGEALSLQAHPSAAQARAGFDREEAAGVPLDAPERIYRDPSPKPEALVALSETWVLCGFREPMAAAELVTGLSSPALDPLVAALRAGGPDGLRDAMAWLVGLAGPERDEVAGAASAGCEVCAGSGDRSDPRWWVARLAADHPGDPACLAPLLLELMRLAPGDAVYLPAGNLHAYLRGAGVEIMAASDNVLRGGLTAKHVDGDELLAVLRFEPGIPPPPLPTEVRPGVTVYECDEPAFALAAVDATRGPVEIDPAGPSLLLAVGGQVDLAGGDGGVSVGHGDAAFVAPGSGPLTVTGAGTLWWATVGNAAPS
ncbi:MAG: mannose-6-phosphate isomerase, class I [Acidimicrobiales bacterium]